MNIGIYIYDQAEVLDFAGPFEVFSTAKRLGATNLNVFLISEQLQTVSARGHFKVMPDYSLQNHPNIDLLVVVGGFHEDEVNKPHIIEWVASVGASAQHVASVCTGAFLLAKAGLLDGSTVTTHWEDISALASQFPNLQVIDNRRWITSDKFTTSGGISAGIDMSLQLVSKYYGLPLAQTVARQIEYQWQTSN
ncbi:DJ-1/PfpI family protein [Vibrio panuliri]|uniref:Glutamine amidotransferase n=1 Tax=Vibrio panuliri TaxID=1381081 RepID=A0ABX3FRC6_9VIBR|nr:DJ-1/PfpI family protein [Vibrio panuliri]KAB1457310.1 DJ-1/PfpI family protein [Vibrio panuliri]OLQ96330.1 glutamine amidotransferase [Vibrio panuliri]